MKKFLLVATLLFSSNTWCAEMRDDELTNDDKRTYVVIVALQRAIYETIGSVEGIKITSRPLEPNAFYGKTEQGILVDLCDSSQNNNPSFPHKALTPFGKIYLVGSTYYADAGDIHGGLQAQKDLRSRLELTELDVIEESELGDVIRYQVDAVDGVSVPPFLGDLSGALRLTSREELSAIHVKWEMLKKWHSAKQNEN